MDRLLQFLLKTFIRRGTFRLTTSRGTKIVFGDGTGKPVAVRFATRAAEWGILLDPELRLGEAYMDGSFVVEQSSIADVLAVVFGQDRTQAFQNGPSGPRVRQGFSAPAAVFGVSEPRRYSRPQAMRTPPRPRLPTTPLRFAKPSPPSGLDRLLPPPSCRSCSAHKKSPGATCRGFVIVSADS